VNVLTRGMRNAFRNTIRTVSIVLILGLSIGLALAMLVARAAVDDKIQSVKSSIGNTVTISPAGARGFEGGGEPLTSDQLAKVATVANVTSVTQTLNDRLTSDNTNLASAVDAGSLGNRRAGNSGVGFQAPPDVRINDTTGSATGGTGRVTRTFTPPVMITGVSALGDTTYGGSSVTYAAGGPIDVTKDEDVAVVGKALAEKNSLSVGSTFQAYGKTLTVKGIYDAGNTFANNGVFVSLASLQRISDQAGSVTSAVATVNSIDNVITATNDIKSVLGDAADVVNNQDTAAEAVQPLESVKTISTASLVGAIIAGAIIILLTMVMIVRERRREIGVYKAIGASNAKIMLQFVSEAVTLTLLAMVAGVIIGAVAANPTTKMLVNNSSSSMAATQQVGPGQGRFRAVRMLGGTTLTSARNVEAHVGYEIIGYGFGAALAIAAIGSALPAFLISKVRPAEVMRAE
jgi:putative ABC transport system permease protein